MTVHYQDDRATLHHGDALHVLANLPDASVDAIITDPPYSSGGMYRSDRTATTATKYVGGDKLDKGVDFTGDNRDQHAYRYWVALWLSEALRTTKPGGVCLLFTDWRQLPTTSDAIQSGGWIWRGIVPWVKPRGTFREAGGRFAQQAEFVVWGSNGVRPIENRGIAGWFHAAPPRNAQREHQTQKPVDVLRELVKIVPEGGTVLDPFAGSGTTGVAAILEGRRFIGAELSTHYVQVAERRIREAEGQPIARGDQAALDFGQPA